MSFMSTSFPIPVTNLYIFVVTDPNFPTTDTAALIPRFIILMLNQILYVMIIIYGMMFHVTMLFVSNFIVNKLVYFPQLVKRVKQTIFIYAHLQQTSKFVD